MVRVELCGEDRGLWWGWRSVVRMEVCDRDGGLCWEWQSVEGMKVESMR